MGDVDGLIAAERAAASKHIPPPTSFLSKPIAPPTEGRVTAMSGLKLKIVAKKETPAPVKEVETAVRAEPVHLAPALAFVDEESSAFEEDPAIGIILSFKKLNRKLFYL